MTPVLRQLSIHRAALARAALARAALARAAVAAAFLAATFIAPLARAQSAPAPAPAAAPVPATAPQDAAPPRYPVKPVRVIVPFAAGGLIDASMRALAPKMAEALGQPVVIDNKGGAGGLIGIQEASHAPADGYTLLFGIESTVLSPFIYKNAGFDPTRDFQPITEVLAVPIAILINPSLPVNNLKELAAYSRVNPGKLSAGSGGTGTATHLCLEMYKWMSGADIVHVPYKGAGPAFTDFLAGQTQVFAVSTSFSAPHVRAGKVKVLAVAAARRASNMPDVPTTAEAGFPGIDFSTWMGFLAPAGVHPAIVEKVRDAAVAALRDPDNVKRFNEQGLDILGTTPAEFGKFISAESAKFGKVVEMARLRPE